MSDRLHRAIFPSFGISDDSTSMRQFNTTAGRSYFVAGRGGPITGWGANLLIIDGPLKDQVEAQSDTIRRSLHQWFGSVAYTRLQPGGACVLIETRWHQEDLAKWLLREHFDQRWEVASLPAIAETDEGWRKEGEWPEHFPLPVLEQIRSAIGGAA